jgi:hypothetical protein
MTFWDGVALVLTFNYVRRNLTGTVRVILTCCGREEEADASHRKP